MEKIKAKKLKKGDNICFLTVSGNIEEFEKLKISEEIFIKNGFNIVKSPSTFTNYGYMSCDDKTRIKEIENAFADKTIDAIVATRGGYGLLRVLNMIDYSIIKNNPKIFVGYSDITTLLAMFYKKTGLISFHGQMALGLANQDQEIINSFFDTLKGNTKEIIAKNPQTLIKGNAKGILWGGNLTTLASMCGVCDFIPQEDFIFFVEDWHEPVYKLDRMLFQLFSQNNFKKYIKGIVFGDFGDTKNEKYFFEMIKDFSKEHNIPCCLGFDISHSDKNICLAYGCDVEFNADEGKIIFEETYLI